MKRAQREMKEVVLSISIEIPQEMEQCEIAKKVTDALKPLSDSVTNVSDLVVRTIPKILVDKKNGPGEYETRLWEKATCRVGVEDPRDRLINPVGQIDELIKQTELLNKQTSLLNEAVINLHKQIPGK